MRSKNAETLPDKARALLTILGPASPAPGEATGPSIADLGRDFAGSGKDTHTGLSASKARLADRVAHLEGIGRGEYTDFSANKRHLDDLGK